MMLLFIVLFQKQTSYTFWERSYSIHRFLLPLLRSLLPLLRSLLPLHRSLLPLHRSLLPLHRSLLPLHTSLLPLLRSLLPVPCLLSVCSSPPLIECVLLQNVFSSQHKPRSSRNFVCMCTPGLFTWQKRPTSVLKETYFGVLRQKRPTHLCGTETRLAVRLLLASLRASSSA